MPGLINLKLLTDFFNKIGHIQRGSIEHRFMGARTW